MKKTIFSLSAAMLLSGALVGCNADNNAANNPDNNGNGARPIGYHSGNGTVNNGMGNGLGDNQDNDLGYKNRTGYNHNNVNDNRDRGNNMGMTNNGNNDHSQQAKTIADKVANMKNVENASVVVTDDNVLVGVDTNDNGVTKNYKTQIRKTVQNVVSGKDIHVTTDPDMYNRIKDASNNLQNGTKNGMNEVGSDVRGIIDDLGSAAKRPFENNNNQ